MISILIFCSMEEINLYLQGMHQLCEVLFPRLNECTIREKQAVRLFASLILCILHLLKRVCQEETDEASIRIMECKDKLHEFVKGWVVKLGVIGGSVFGGQIVSKYREQAPKFTGKELTVIFNKHHYVMLINDVIVFHSAPCSYGRTCLN